MKTKTPIRHESPDHRRRLQTRDFVFVGDLARLLAEALQRRILAGQAINVGRGQASSLLDLIAALETLGGRPLTRTHVAVRGGDIRHSRADVTRLRTLLGLVPSTDLVTGLDALLRYRPA